MSRYALILLALLLTSCTSKTDFGDCIGIDDSKDASLQYEISTTNVIVGIVFVETVVVPVVVALEQTYCPIGRKAKP